MSEGNEILLEIAADRIVSVGVAVSYDHRPLERWCESGSFSQALGALSRPCGICGHAHAPAFLSAVERIMGIQPPPRGAVIRLILAELERSRVHLEAVAGSARAGGFHSLAAELRRESARVASLVRAAFGTHPIVSLDAPGGPRRDLSPAQAQELERGARWTEERGKRYLERFTESGPIVARLGGVGLVTREEALRLGAPGPVARASGVTRDLRRDSPYGAYLELRPEPISGARGDALGRVQLRLGELIESCRTIRHAAARLPAGPYAVEVPARAGPGQAICRVESPSGEELQEVAAAGTDRPQGVEIRPASASVPRLLASALIGVRLEDACIAVAGLDPRLADSGCVVSVRERGAERERRLRWSELERIGMAPFGGGKRELEADRAS